MTNDSKLGLFAGISVLLIVAVFFHPKSAVGPASISNQSQAVNVSQLAQTSQVSDLKHDSLLGVPAKVSTPNNNLPEKPTDQPKPIGTNMADSGISTWKAETPRSQQPVSRDPLLWP